jgi:hypothetical protein
MKVHGEALLPTEQIIYRGHKHWIVFGYPLLWLIVGFIFLVHIIALQKLAVIPLLLALLTGIHASINYFISELVITNLRLLINIGFVQRISLQAPLENITSVQAQQNLLGHLFRYGTIKVCDTNEMCLAFEKISKPMKFQRHAQRALGEQIIPQTEIVQEVEEGHET